MRRLSLCVLVFFISWGHSTFAADRVWVGGSSSNWFDAANWNPNGVPLPNESVSVSNFTTIVLSDNATVRALELRGAILVVSNQLVVSNLFIGNGARLNAWATRPNPITNPPPASGIVEIPSGGTMQIGDSDGPSAFGMEGTKLNLRGSGLCTNRSGTLLFYLSEFNVYGSLELRNEFSFDGANGPPAGSLNVYGTLRRPSGTNVSLLLASLTNRGTILLQSGTMNIGAGANGGVINTSSGATQSFAGTFQWLNGGTFTGGGTVRLVRGTFDCGTNDLYIPNLHWPSPGMMLQGTNTITVAEALWEFGSLAGAGDFIPISHLTLRGTPPGSFDKRVLGTRRIVNRSKMVFGTNATITFLDRSSLRNESFIELENGSVIFGFAAAAPHPDVSVLNMGTIASHAATTNSIWIRCTNYGTIRVDGRLQLYEKYNIQKAGSTVVEGTLVAPTSGYRIDGGILQGNGIVEATVRNAGTISPGSSPGTLTISGSLTNNGLLPMELALGTSGPVSDLLSVSNHFRLGGSLVVSYSGDAWPPEGTTWEILRFGSSSGSFQALEGLDFGGGHVLLPVFSPTNLVLVVSNQPPTKYTFTTVRPSPGQLELRFTGDPDATYSIEVSSNLVLWSQLVQTNRPDGILYLRNITTTQPQIFYRARAIQ